MADYYSVLARAVAALPENTAAGRRVIYEKARTALVRQLEGLNPPLPPAEIAKQRLALEEAVRRIESETARAAFSSPRAPAKPPAPRTEPPRVETRSEPPRPAGDAAPAAPPREEPPAPTVPTRIAEPPRAAEPPPRRPLFPAAPARPTGEPGAEAPPVEVDGRQRREPGLGRPAAPPAPAVAAIPPTAAEAVAVPTDDDDDAEDAAAAAPDRKQERARQREERAARRRKAEPAAEAADGEAAAAPAAESADAPPFIPAPRAEKKPKPEKPRRAPRERKPLPLRPLIAAAAVFVVVVLAAAAAYLYSDTLVAMMQGRPLDAMTASAPPASDGAADPAATGETPADATAPAAEQKNTERLPGQDAAGAPAGAPESRTVQTSRIVATPPADGAAPAAPGTPDAGAPDAGTAPADGAATPDAAGAAPDAAAPAADATAPAAEPGASPPAAAATDAPSAPPPTDSPDSGLVGPSRSILYEDGEVAGTRGVALAGTAKWEMVRESIGGGPEEPIVRATVAIPERSVTATLIFRRNRDQALPASHLIEVAFELPVNFAGGGITNLPAIVMKTSESTRGDALIGASARVSDGLFWIALSASENDVATNLELLRDRGWIDLPMLYNNGRRAILTIEKGSAGAKAIDDALAAWASEK